MEHKLPSMNHRITRARTLALEMDAFGLLKNNTVEEAEAIIKDVLFSCADIDYSDDRICARARQYLR
jgi:hypothetical protein